jgi:molybdopterin synthase sulfurylase MoeB
MNNMTSSPISLSASEESRYARQIALPSVDFDGQETLKASRVAIVGVGGLGCSAAQYLAASGIGHLTLIDFDVVELSNLQRQVLHQTVDIGINKAQSAAQLLQLNNPEIVISAITDKLDDSAMSMLCQEHDVIVDCCDNLATREQLNKACFVSKTPLVSGAAIRLEGLVTAFDYRENSPCYHCFSQLFGEQQLSCVEAGVLAPSVGIIGAIEASETLKLLLGIGQSLVGRVLIADFNQMSFREMKLSVSSNCPVCHTHS